MFKKVFSIIIIFFVLNQHSLAVENVKIFEFTNEEMKTLQVRKVKGKTTYTFGSNENGNYLKAEAEGKASGLGKELKINLLKTPFINITWKVEKDLPGIIENSKKGHDYAARVFVVKKTGATALSNRAINYVFSSNNSINESWTSPYTKKSIDNVLATTITDLNKWVTVKSNVENSSMELNLLNPQGKPASTQNPKLI